MECNYYDSELTILKAANEPEKNNNYNRIEYDRIAVKPTPTPPPPPPPRRSLSRSSSFREMKKNFLLIQQRKNMFAGAAATVPPPGFVQQQQQQPFVRPLMAPAFAAARASSAPPAQPRVLGMRRAWRYVLVA